MSKLDNLESHNIFEFISLSKDENDFQIRFQQFIRIALVELSVRINEEAKFTFQTVKIIDDINNDMNRIIKQINETPIIENQKDIAYNLLMEVIKIHIPKLYLDYRMYTNYIYN